MPWKRVSRAILTRRAAEGERPSWYSSNAANLYLIGRPPRR